jgi:hypothetical protein
MNLLWKAAFLALISGAMCLAQTISGSVATIAGDPVNGVKVQKGWHATVEAPLIGRDATDAELARSK